MQRRREDAEIYGRRALKYRGECLRHASETMPRDGQPVTDYAIGMSGHLSLTEVCIFMEMLPFLYEVFFLLTF